ncbi:helix-turn-helix domain-containing protein [Labrys neptuniae]
MKGSPKTSSWRPRNRQHAKERKLMQEEVEVSSGFSQQYLSNLERGKRSPTIITLFELVQALGVSHVDLVLPPEEE